MRKLLLEVIKALAIVGLTLVVARNDWMSTAAPAAAQAAPAPAAASAADIVTLDPFVVNVASTGGSPAYVRATLAITLPDQAQADTLRSNELTRARVRAALVEELSGQAVQAVVTADGRAALAKRLQARAGATLGSPSLEVLITDFVAEY